jgi:AcrR family transcriptional regulator
MSLPPSPAAKLPRIDGRRLRSERTRQVIMEAYIALLREQPEIPTAAEIAVRAGISTRSVFERFDDLQSLSLATVDYAFTVGDAQAVMRNLDGDRPLRLKSHVEMRAGTCERWLPLWRVVIANQGKLGELKERIGFIRQVVVKRIELMYQPELSTLAEGERRDLLIALEALTDFESWGRMREIHGLSFDDACSLWVRVIDRLLPPTPASGHGR